MEKDLTKEFPITPTNNDNKNKNNSNNNDTY